MATRAAAVLLSSAALVIASRATGFRPLRPALNRNSLDIDVTAFGADPTGKNDSTSAIQDAIEAAANISSSPGRPSVIGSGGVSVNLVGGTYLISAPLTFYGGRFAGIVFRGGSLVASGAFPLEYFALDLRQVSEINIEDVIIDMQHAGGCARFDDTLQSTVTNMFCLHYSSWGVLGDNKVRGDAIPWGAVLASRLPPELQFGMGHELTVADSTFAEFMWGEPGYNVTAQQNGTAIEVCGWQPGATASGAHSHSCCTDALPRLQHPERRHPLHQGGRRRPERVQLVAEPPHLRDVQQCAGVGVRGRGTTVGPACAPSSAEDPSGANVAVGFYAGGSQTRISQTYFDDSPVRRSAAARAAQCPAPALAPPVRSSSCRRTRGC